MKQIAGFDWENMRLFLAVARAGSARAAADDLQMHYTSISRRITAFEKRMGARLFDKSVNGFALTEHGQLILRHGEAMENEAFSIERLLTGADDRIGGDLRVTMSSTIAAFLLTDGLRDFCDAYPDINLSIDTGYKFANFNRREADVTIRVSDNPGDLLVGRKLGTYHQSIYARPDYLKDHSPNKKNSGCRWLDWVSDEAFAKRLGKSEFPFVQHYLQIEDELLLLEAAKSGMGIATLPCFYGDATPELIRISSLPPTPVLGLWLLTHPDLRKNAKVQCFISFFTAVLINKRDMLDGKI